MRCFLKLSFIFVSAFRQGEYIFFTFFFKKVTFYVVQSAQIFISVKCNTTPRTLGGHVQRDTQT